MTAATEKSDQMAAAEKEVRKLLIEERRRQISQRRALRIVIQLAKKTVSPHFLCLALNFIEPQHWDDAVDERNAEGLCGYVLCNNAPLMTENKKSRYRICARTNQVYDMDEYNPFCSVKCAKASRHLREQISVSPLITRENASRLSLSFLGDKKETEAAGVEGKEEKEEAEGESETTKDEGKEEAEGAKMEAAASEEKLHVTRKRRVPSKPPQTDPPAPRPHPLALAKGAVRSWLSPASLSWLDGGAMPPQAGQGDSGRKERRFRVRKAPGKEEEEVVVPLVDSLSQDAIRCRIVGQKLTSSLRELGPALGLAPAIVQAPLRQILSTFEFTATNIVLRPAEWNAALLLLLQILSRREPAVRAVMASEGALQVLKLFQEDGDFGTEEMLCEASMLCLD